MGRRLTTTATTTVVAGMLVSRVNVFAVAAPAHAFADQCRRRYNLPRRRLFRYDRSRTTVCAAQVVTSASKFAVTVCYIHPVSNADSASLHPGWLQRRQSASTKKAVPGVRQRAPGLRPPFTNPTAKVQSTVD